MPIITNIEKQKNNDNRVNIYLDDKFYAGMNLEVVVKNHLKKNMEITYEKLEELVLDDEKSSAFDKALKYIGSSIKTTKQIKDYLNKKEYNSCTTAYVIDKLTEYKYLDDGAYIRAYVSSYKNKYGKMKLITNLKVKGINKELIDEYFSEEVELESNIESVASKYLKGKNMDYKTMQKLSRFLISRGYEFDEINSLIQRLKADD